ncbi:MAG: hypothetical protein K5930_04210 [Treponemataceae bacterium]|nr:hypothetical protein [Treponemataceae bacterium]
MNITFFTKEEVKQIKERIFAYCTWDDTIMNRFEDLFTKWNFPDDCVLEMRSEVKSTKPPKMEMKQILIK